MNLFHYSCCKPPTYFGHFLWPFSGRHFTKIILQRRPSQCTNIKYYVLAMWFTIYVKFKIQCTNCRTQHPQHHLPTSMLIHTVHEHKTHNTTTLLRCWYTKHMNTTPTPPPSYLDADIHIHSRRTQHPQLHPIWMLIYTYTAEHNTHISNLFGCWHKHTHRIRTLLTQVNVAQIILSLFYILIYIVNHTHKI